MSATKPRMFMTGASGYIGSVIIEFAASRYTIHGLSRTPENDTKLRNLGAVPIRGDLSSFDVLTQESSEAQVVIHLADAWAGSGFSKPYEEVIGIDAAAVDAMGKGLIGRDGVMFITTSGSLVVEPDENGGETTETSELAKKPLNGRIAFEKHAFSLADKGVKVCVIRLAPFVYGRGGSGVKLFMGLFKANGEAVYVGDGSTRTSAIHVDDAARMYLLAVEKAKAGDVFNGTSSTDVTAKEIVEAMGKSLDVPVKSLSFEETVEKAGRIVAAFFTSQNRASCEKAKKELGWQPREKGLIEEILTGSYLTVAEELKKGGTSFGKFP